jgi:transposase
MALAMIMTLALMVYSLGQRQLRLALEKANATLPDQKGKPSPYFTLATSMLSLCPFGLS